MKCAISEISSTTSTSRFDTSLVTAQLWKGGRKPDEEGKPNGSAQFWLVPAWHYVPFKIKVVNAQGRSLSLELTAVNAE